MRATEEVAKARRAKRRADAKKAGMEPCRTGLARDAWHLMLTKALNWVSNEHHIHALVIAAMIVHHLPARLSVNRESLSG